MSNCISQAANTTFDKRASVLFVNLPSIPMVEVENYLAGRSVSSAQLHGEPLGILYVASSLKKHCQVSKLAVLDYALGLINARNYKSCEEYILKYAQETADFAPDIIGFSINFTCSHRFLLRSAEILRVLFPNSIIVVGGFHATNATRELLESQNIDYVFRGESEISFTKFVEFFNKNTLSGSDIKGVYNRNKLLNFKKPEIINTSANVTLSPEGFESCESPENLDLLPFPDRSIINMEQCASQQGRTTVLSKTFSKKKASIITNRGCYNQCTFCASRTVFPRKMRFRSTENILEEMSLLNREYGINFFVIEDDLFTGNKELCLDFLEKIKHLNIKDLEIQFPNDLNINTTDEEIFDAMIGAGLKVAHLAVESGSDYVQKKIIKKFANLTKVKPHVQYLQSCGVVVKCIYILGFPGETIELMQETIEFAKRVGGDWSLFNIATPLLGTPMCDQFIERGDIPRDLDLLADIDFKYRSFDTKEISAKDLNNLQYRANLEINFVNNRNYLNGQYKLAIDIYEEIVNKYPFHVIALACLRRCYVKIGDKKMEETITEKLRLVIDSDLKAGEMYLNFGFLVPELSEFEYLIPDKKRRHIIEKTVK